MARDMRLWQKRGIWYVEIERGVSKSLHTKDKGEARRLYTAIREEYLAGRLREIRQESVATVADLKEAYCSWSEGVHAPATARANRLAFQSLGHIISDSTKLEDIGEREADRLRAEGRKRGWRPATVSNYLRHLKAAFAKAAKWGMVKRNPWREVSPGPIVRRHPETVTREQVGALLAQCEGPLRLLVLAYLATGRRRCELLDLTWGDVDLEGGTYTVRQGKDRKDRLYPINSTFRIVLDALDKNGERVFPAMHPDTVSHKVKAALQAVGLGSLRLHDLRHTFAVQYISSGGSMRALQDLLGHSEYRTTEIYAHFLPGRLQEEAERVSYGPVVLPKK